MQATTVPEAQQLSCPSCGAPVPVTDPKEVPCLYCLTRVPVPSAFGEPLAEHRELWRRLEKTTRDLSDVREGFALRLTGWKLYALAIAVVVVWSMAPQVDFERFEKYPHQLLSFGMGVLFYAGFIGAVVVAIWVSSRKASRRLASLPLVRLSASSELQTLCPHCGAPGTPEPTALTLECQSCHTEALLPAVLIDRALQKKHRKILSMRRHVDLTDTTIRGAEQSGSKIGAYVCFGAGAAIIATYVAFWQFNELPPIARSPASKIFISFFPGLFMASPLFFIGAMWRSGRR